MQNICTLYFPRYLPIVQFIMGIFTTASNITFIAFTPNSPSKLIFLG